MIFFQDLQNIQKNDKNTYIVIKLVKNLFLTNFISYNIKNNIFGMKILFYCYKKIN